MEEPSEIIMECVCPVGRRNLLSNPEGLFCEDGYNLVPETIPFECPDGSIIDCSGPSFICENGNGETMPPSEIELTAEPSEIIMECVCPVGRRKNLLSNPQGLVC